MRVLYLDCFAGISGDMLLGSLLAAGADLNHLKESIGTLPFHHIPDITYSTVKKASIAAGKASVIIKGHEHSHRGLLEIEEIISRAALPERAKKRAIDIFTRLAIAEAAVHGCGVNEIHFHEVGAVDSIVDIVGAAVCLEDLGIDDIYSSPLPTFHGSVKCAHGVIPLPAPATVELLKGARWRECGIEAELVTPTGAAVLAALARRFGPMPSMAVEKIGYGAGERDLQIPNILRAFVGTLGETVSADPDVVIVEANIDDMNPQYFDHVFETLLRLGALDVFILPIQMKKSRPAFMLSIICEEKDLQQLTEALFRETTTIGVRYSSMHRRCLERQVVEVETDYGPIGVKIGILGGNEVNAQPEYDDCAAAARKHEIPLKTVHDHALQAWLSSRGPRK